GATFTLASTDLIEARMSGIEKIVAAGVSNQIISITVSDLVWEAGVTTIDLSADTNATGSNVIDVSNDDTGDNAWTLTGSAGIDTITGDSGVDTITGGAGADVIDGGAGADVIDGGAGADVIDGGAGEDVFVYVATADLVASNALVDTLTGGSGTADAIAINNNGGATFTLASTDLIEARMSGIEKIVASGATDQVISITVSDLVWEDGVTTIDLSADTNATGSNVIDVSNDNTGTNAWTLTGSAGIDTITGDSGADTITSGSGADAITGGDGIDTIILASGANTISDLGVTGDADVVDLNGGTVIATTTGAWTATSATDNAGANAAAFTINVASAGAVNLTSASTSAYGYTVVSTGTSAVTGSDDVDVLTNTSGDATMVGLAGADTFTATAGA
ncbi:MAG TPA: calcium-binding protein, partial [Myxococcales bacterium]|nr:calcium-binding protein [Myxococcales bacterium]